MRMTAAVMYKQGLPTPIPTFSQQGRQLVDRLQSGTRTFAELNLDLDLLDRGEVLRQILQPNG